MVGFEDARRLVARYVEHNNTVRLHSAIGYVTSQDMLEGRQHRGAKPPTVKHVVAPSNTDDRESLRFQKTNHFFAGRSRQLRHERGLRVPAPGGGGSWVRSPA